MRVVIDLKSYYEWVPAPVGTKITEDDVAQLRAKRSVGDSWLVRVAVDRETIHETGFSEEQITARLAACEKLGRPSSRADVVHQLVRSVLPHHAHAKHVLKFTVHDGGPDVELYRRQLAAAGVPAEDMDEAIARYGDAEGPSIEDFLNMSYATPAFREDAKAKAAAKVAGKTAAPPPATPTPTKRKG